MRISILLIFVFINNFVFSQDTTVKWLTNIDTSSYKMFYERKNIPEEAYKVIGMNNKDDIANPTDNWTPSCLVKPHQGLNWIAKDKKGHMIISVTYGAKSITTRYFYFDKEKGQLNINELTFGRKRLTFGQTVKLIKTKEFEFEEFNLDD